MTSWAKSQIKQQPEPTQRWSEAIRYEPTEDGWQELTELSEIGDDPTIVTVQA